MNFKPGLENFLSNFKSSKTVNVGIVTNYTGRNSNGISILNLINDDPRFDLKLVFSPEHGFSSQEPDGEHVSNSVHKELSIPIISLYGSSKNPDISLFSDLDILLYDIQDVGVRFYTYISTLKNVIDAAEKTQTPVHILDRPDILGGKIVEGPDLRQGFESFVSHLPIPLRYGMTPGELGKWWKQRNNYKLDLIVWECQDYACPTVYEDLKFPWFKPSPSMHSTETAKFYPGTCLFEGTNLSEGRGTRSPFQTFGAPWFDSERFLEIYSENFSYPIQLNAIEFLPTFSKFAGENCRGIEISATDHFLSNSVEIGLAMIFTCLKVHGDLIEFTPRPNLDHPFFDYLAGTDSIRNLLISEAPFEAIIHELKKDLADFNESRQKVLIYKRT